MEAGHVSDKDLLNDIENTIIEHAAYVNIYKGFRDLSNLPENVGSMAREAEILYKEYLSLSNECYKFLMQLNKIKEERGL
jgi:hypothetical protein